MKQLTITGALLASLAGAAHVDDRPNLIKQNEAIANMMPGDEATMVKANE